MSICRSCFGSRRYYPQEGGEPIDCLACGGGDPYASLTDVELETALREIGREVALRREIRERAELARQVRALRGGR